MRVKTIHIITMMELGGAQQNTLYTVAHLSPERFEPFLITGPGGPLFGEAAALGNHFVAPDLIREIRPLRDTKALIQLVRSIVRIQAAEPRDAPVIVHTHSSKAGILGRLAARLCRVPVIIHSIHGFPFHDFQPDRVRRFYIALEKGAACLTTHFISVSEAAVDTGCRLGIFSPECVSLIRSGIDIDRFRNPERAENETRAELGIPQGVPLVTMIACLKPQKDPVTFVEAAAVVLKEVPDAHFLLVGNGTLRDEVQKRIQAFGLAERFHLAGWRRDIPEILHATTVFVLTSLWEGLPRVLPQALAAGVPVVATAVDGSPEAVQDGRTGFLTRPGDAAGIARRVVDLLKNPAQVRTMMRSAEEVLPAFDQTLMVEQQEQLYMKLIASKV